jgi:hypothetical protein
MMPVAAPQSTSTSTSSSVAQTTSTSTPPRTSTSHVSTSTTARAIAHNANATRSYGSGGLDTVSRWTSLVLATLVAMLSAFGYLLRRAHHRARSNISR